MNHYSVSSWPDVDSIAAKMERLVNDRLYSIKPDAMARYLGYFETKCARSKALIALASSSWTPSS